MLLLVLVVWTLLAAVALSPHGAVAHAPVLVPVRGRPRVQPEMRENDIYSSIISDRGSLFIIWPQP